MVQTIAQFSPFKFLDSYGREDRPIFFGRDDDIDALYELVMSSQLTLVYGASGTGKTSLVECGLGNRFSETDWLALRIRKGDDIINSTFQAIRDCTHPDIIISDTESSIYNAVQALYLHYYIPIYLIFDQFEELIISGTRDEQEKFFLQLKNVLESGKPCKVILVMREEYIAYLSQYESLIPTLFDNKHRVEKMNQLKLQTVIMCTIQAPQYNIIFEEPEKNTKTIIENLRNERREVDLTNLQVYLDRLYREDLKRIEENDEKRPITFDSILIEDKVGKLPQVLSDFLDEQMSTVDDILKYPNISLNLLSEFVTDDGTKRSRTKISLIEDLRKSKIIPPSVSLACIQKFYERRILKELRISDELQFEITHDLLARQIFNRFSAEEKILRKATAMIQDAYDFHAELSIKGEGISFMNEEHLSYLQNIIPKLSLSDTLVIYIQDSKAAIKEEKEKEKLMLQREVELQKQQLAEEEKNQALQKTLLEKERQEHIRNQEESRKAREQTLIELKNHKRRLVIDRAIGLSMFFLALYTMILFSRAKNSKNEIQMKKNEIQKLLDTSYILNKELNSAFSTIKQRNEELYKAFLKNGDTKASSEVKQYLEAIVEYRGAISIDNKDSIRITKLIEQCEINNTQLKKREELQRLYDEYIREGSRILDTEARTQNQLLFPEEYLTAQSKFDSAEKLLTSISDEKNEIRMKEKKAEIKFRIKRAFDIYFDRGERFKKVKGYKEASKNYNYALLLKPDDSLTIQAIEECENLNK